MVVRFQSAAKFLYTLLRDRANWQDYFGNRAGDWQPLDFHRDFHRNQSKLSLEVAQACPVNRYDANISLITLPIAPTLLPRSQKLLVAFILSRFVLRT
jgi:hypothetical protein